MVKPIVTCGLGGYVMMQVHRFTNCSTPVGGAGNRGLCAVWSAGV